MGETSVKGKIGKIIAKLICSLFVAAICAFAVIIQTLINNMNIELHKYKEPLSAAIIAVIAIIGLMIILICIWGVHKKAIIVIQALLLIASIGGYIAIYMEYEKDLNIPKVVADVNLTKLYPGYVDDNPNLAKLEENSKLTISENMPVMDGATALYPVYAAFARAVYPKQVWEHGIDSTSSYENKYLHCSTTAGAYDALIKRECDIIFVASPSKKQEEIANENGVRLKFTPIGKESFVFFVNSENELDNISIEQVKDVYSGKITKWEELGIKSLGDIRPFQREEGSGSQTYLQKLMEDTELMEAEREDVSQGMGMIVNQVADYKNYKNAIGFSFRYFCTEMVNSNSIKLLSLNGVAPTRENILNNTYPLTGDFYAVTRSNCSKETKQLIEWILSEQGQELIEKTGYVKISE